MEKEVKQIMDRDSRREARAARREARAARRNPAGIDPVNKSAASSLREIMQKTGDVTGNVTKQAVNDTVGTTVDKVIDKGAETISKAFDKGIKQVSDLFDNEKQTDENHSDVAPLNKECCAECKSKNIWVPAEFNIVHKEGDADNEPTESWLIGCYDCGYYDVCIWNEELTELDSIYAGYEYIERATDINDGRASQANIDDYIRRNITDEDLYVDESTNQYNSTSSPASDNTSLSVFGCLFWIFIGFIFLVIFT